MSGISASVTANWHYRERAWPHISDSGSADISIASTTVVIDIGFSVNGNGGPTCKVIAGGLNIGDFKITLHGGASWLYSIFVNIFKGQIKDAIANALKNAIESAIDNNLNALLQTLPLKQNIMNILLADYSLVDAPRFGNDYMVIDGKGEFFDIKNPQEAPFSPDVIPDVQNTNVMVQFTLSQYIPDTAAYALWKSGILELKVTDSMVPPDSPIRLNTDTFKYIIPILYQLYPSKPLVAIVDPIACPLITFLSNGTIGIFGQFSLSMFVDMGAGNLTHVFTLGVNLTTEGNVYMNGSLIMIVLTYGDAGLWLIETDIGTFDISPLYNIAILTISELIPLANVYFSKGIPLPTIPKITFIKPYLGYGNKYVFVNTDVQYNR